MVRPCLVAADELSARGYEVSVFSVPTIQPIDAETIRSVIGQVPRIVSVEEHGAGGLGSAMAEILAEAGSSASFRIMRLPSIPIFTAGTQEQLRDLAGLGVQDIMRYVMQQEGA